MVSVFGFLDNMLQMAIRHESFITCTKSCGVLLTGPFKIYHDQKASLYYQCLAQETDESCCHKAKMEIILFIKMYNPPD